MGAAEESWRVVKAEGRRRDYAKAVRVVRRGMIDFGGSEEVAGSS